ncbi:MAG: helix-turn-helix domain-containing protein [Firmicutes bacterium]|nr:helix-turn-helix domain-containing protein [Bacillota bacterium]
MAQVDRIRWLLHREAKSQREVARELGISRHTVAKYANRTEVPKYQRQEPRKPSVLTPEFRVEIDRLLAENETLPRKQRWIGQTIFSAIQAMGYQGSQPTVLPRYQSRPNQERLAIPFHHPTLLPTPRRFSHPHLLQYYQSP